MEKKQKLFVSFTVTAIAVIITMAGCVGLKGTESPTFVGTWERANLEYPHTLTFTSNILKASNQTSFWNLTFISGDAYTISDSDDPSFKGTIYLKIVNDTLEIVDAYDFPNANEWVGGEDDWTGTWKRK
ncbi:MAG: hypothetical protein LBQ77_03095 [Treponema sp.]|jgi:hypothetical protein|nr:hypothetical protein [Treponema sp.]